MKNVYVTKTYLPEFQKYVEKIKVLWEEGIVTNHGKYVQILEQRLKDYLGVKYLVLTANGTLALQLAYKLLGLKGEVITTPFSFVATTSSLVWEGLKPVFADIEPESLTIDPKEIERKITKETSAIVPVHVYGNACNMEQIDSIAKRHNLNVIYDAAHCFGVRYKGESILNYGDISVLSFHATKLFHTIEGGAIVLNDEKLYKRAKQMTNFGYEGGEIRCLGINAKMNEFEAAMGLCLLEDIDDVIGRRKQIWEFYYNALHGYVRFPKWNVSGTKNYSYFPVIFDNEKQLLKVIDALNAKNVYPRRYFYPSLGELTYASNGLIAPVASHVAQRVLCLPLYESIGENNVKLIAGQVRNALEVI